MSKVSEASDAFGTLLIFDFLLFCYRIFLLDGRLFIIKLPGHEDASLKLQVAWQQNVIDQLLGAESFPAAKALVSRMKAEYKIKKTGPLSTCKNPAECYMLVGKDGKVETVLGPGSGTRTDFRTLTSAPATLPANTDIIWFTFAK